MGDIRQLEGKQIEIKGTIQDYDGRAEIVLRRTQQLGNGAFLVFPPVPTDYDVEHQGHDSAGKFVRSKVKKTTTKEGDPVSIEDPGEPQYSCGRVTPFPYAIHPEHTLCRATRYRRSRRYETSSAAMCT